MWMKIYINIWKRAREKERERKVNKLTIGSSMWMAWKFFFIFNNGHFLKDFYYHLRNSSMDQ